MLSSSRPQKARREIAHAMRLPASPRIQDRLQGQSQLVTEVGLPRFNQEPSNKADKVHEFSLVLFRLSLKWNPGVSR